MKTEEQEEKGNNIDRRREEGLKEESVLFLIWKERKII